jgi:hypothetical protein
MYSFPFFPGFNSLPWKMADLGTNDDNLHINEGILTPTRGDRMTVCDVAAASPT